MHSQIADQLDRLILNMNYLKIMKHNCHWCHVFLKYNLVSGVFTSLVSVFKELVPAPNSFTHQHPLATSLLQIISALIGQGNERYNNVGKVECLQL